MQTTPEVTYLGVEKTAALDKLISKEIAKLEKICDYIISINVAVESYSRRHRTGNYYRIRINLRIPPKHEMVVKRTSGTEGQLEPLPAVIRKTFEAAGRQLETLVEKQRKEIKAHNKKEVMALVDNIFRAEGYGYLRSLGGQQVYFHKNSCHDDWEKIEPGMNVRYISQEGEKGLQASSVEIIDKPTV